MKKLRFIIIVLCTIALFIFLTLIASVAQASLTTIIVNSTEQETPPYISDGDCSLSEAIASAVADTAIDNCTATTGSFGTGGPFVIELATGATYTLTAIDNSSNGLPTFSGYTRHITINGNGSVIERSTVTGTPDFRIINISHIGSLTLNNLTIRNGQELSEGGGGINKWGGTLTLNDCTISGNTARYGGGIYSLGQLTLNNGVISGNNATEIGGGVLIEMSGYSVLNNTTINNNTAGIEGGGIYHLFSISTLVNSTVSSNTTGMHGGGISNVASDFNLSNATISGNSTNEDGGGIYVSNSDTFTGTVSLTNTTITNNTADSDNNGTGNGGGIFKVVTTTVKLQNTILAGNTDSGGENSDCSNILTSLGNNLFGDNVDCPVGSSDLDLITLGLGIENVLEPLGSNGGSTQTHALIVGSPAINTGNNDSCSVTDQRGIARPQGAKCDIGAYEATPMLTLNKGADNVTPSSGDLITYTIILTNSGAISTTKTLISDTIPIDLNFVGPITIVPTGTGTLGNSDTLPVLVIDLTVSAGENITITYPVTIDNGLAAGKIITNTVTVTSAEVTIPVTEMVSISIVNDLNDQIYLPLILKYN